MSVTGLSREQLEAVEKVIGAIQTPQLSTSYMDGWTNALLVALDAIRSQLVMKVEVAPTATATGTIEGLDGLGRRAGDG